MATCGAGGRSAYQRIFVPLRERLVEQLSEKTRENMKLAALVVHLLVVLHVRPLKHSLTQRLDDGEEDETGSHYYLR